MSLNKNLTERSKPAHLLIGTLVIAILALAASPNFATARATTRGARGLGMAATLSPFVYHPARGALQNPKAQLIRMLAQGFTVKDAATERIQNTDPAAIRGHIPSPREIRPETWAGSVVTMMAQAQF